MDKMEERLNKLHCPLCDKDLTDEPEVQWIDIKGRKVPVCAKHPRPGTERFNNVG